MGVWVVVVVLALGTVAVVVASRHHSGDVEPTVREFTEFRDALSRQVTGLSSDTRAVNERLHLGAPPRPVEHDGRS